MPTAGRRIFELTPGANPAADPREWDEEYGRIFALARETGVPTTFGLFGSSDQRAATLREVESSMSLGAEVFVQTHSRGPSSVLSLKSRLPFDVLPEWRELRARPVASRLAALRDPETRRRLVEAAEGDRYGDRSGAEPRRPNHETMTVLYSAVPPNPTVSGLGGRAWGSSDRAHH